MRVARNLPHNPYAIPLIPPHGPDIHSRNGFYMHGNNSSNNASEGCVICPLPARQGINNRGGGQLNVVP